MHKQLIQLCAVVTSSTYILYTGCSGIWYAMVKLEYSAVVAFLSLPPPGKFSFDQYIKMGYKGIQNEH